jgi:hypothetical protein
VEDEMVTVPSKSNGNDKDFHHNFHKIDRYLDIVENHRIISYQIKNSQVVTTFKFYTEYWKNIYYFH